MIGELNLRTTTDIPEEVKRRSTPAERRSLHAANPMTQPDLIPGLDPGWALALQPVAPRIRAMGDFLRAEIAAGRRYLPAGDRVLRAFQQPLSDVRVLIVGQDPYPTPGNPVGLSFSVAPEVQRLPPSLINIFQEYTTDLGYPAPANGDLTPWAERGVLLLNRVLTVAPGQPGSHRGKGWEEVTEQAIRALAARPEPLVAILWGRDARNLAPLLDGVPLIESAHPSPNSADRGFFGSRPFSRANALLEARGAPPIDWKLPDPADPAIWGRGAGRAGGHRWVRGAPSLYGPAAMIVGTFVSLNEGGFADSRPAPFQPPTAGQPGCRRTIGKRYFDGYPSDHP
jgi:uracil-DNA glycosylase